MKDFILVGLLFSVDSVVVTCGQVGKRTDIRLYANSVIQISGVLTERMVENTLMRI